MHRTLEKQLAARAVELGKSGDGAALPELVELLGGDSVQVRRLAASAIGKLAGFANAEPAVAAVRAHLDDAHPQVRQYAVKALKAYGADASDTLSDLRDMAANESEKEYNRRDAQAAIDVIEEALRIKEKEAVHRCQRCGLEVGADEFARSQRAFQRCFCDRCFDEVYLERRNFDTRVELNKTVRADDGTLVQSRGERRVADWLTRRGIAYRYDERVRIIEGYAVRPDFYLPEFDLYVEYWGMDTTDYRIAMLKKKKLYQQEGKQLVSINREDSDRIESALEERLSRHIRLADNKPAGTTAESASDPTAAEPPTKASIPEVGEDAETACMFEVLGRYRHCLRLLLFHDTGASTPDRALGDAERLQRTRAYCVRLRKKLAAALEAIEEEEEPPSLSSLLRRLADMPPSARGKNRARHQPPLLGWKLTHHQDLRKGMMLSEATACLLWSLRVTGQLDPEDERAPPPGRMAALMLFLATAPEGTHRKAVQTVLRMLTPLPAPRHQTLETTQT